MLGSHATFCFEVKAHAFASQCNISAKPDYQTAMYSMSCLIHMNFDAMPRSGGLI